jgi:predicted kinase
VRVPAHLQLARELLLPAVSKKGLVLMSGTVGSGKSTAAEVAADAMRGVVIASDPIRRRLAGLAPRERATADLYTPEWNRRVYDALLEQARPIVASGRVAVLDATFSRREERDRAAAWARERSLPCLLLVARCPPDEAQARLEKRANRGDSPSDAGPEFLQSSIDRYEPPAEWDATCCEQVDTSLPGWANDLKEHLLRRSLAAGQQVPAD